MEAQVSSHLLTVPVHIDLQEDSLKSGSNPRPVTMLGRGCYDCPSSGSGPLATTQREEKLLPKGTGWTMTTAPRHSLLCTRKVQPLVKI